MTVIDDEQTFIIYKEKEQNHFSKLRNKKNDIDESNSDEALLFSKMEKQRYSLHYSCWWAY